jgi:hypothetical protein
MLTQLNIYALKEEGPRVDSSASAQLLMRS